MRDISARELKGHNILAVERFQDNTRWMIEFSVLRPSTAYGSPGEEIRLFLTEDRYQAALQSQQRREIKIKRYARVIEGHILDFKPQKHITQIRININIILIYSTKNSTKKTHKNNPNLNLNL